MFNKGVSYKTCSTMVCSILLLSLLFFPSQQILRTRAHTHKNRYNTKQVAYLPHGTNPKMLLIGAIVAKLYPHTCFSIPKPIFTNIHHSVSQESELTENIKHQPIKNFDSKDYSTCLFNKFFTAQIMPG